METAQAKVTGDVHVAKSNGHFSCTSLPFRGVSGVGRLFLKHFLGFSPAALSAPSQSRLLPPPLSLVAGDALGSFLDCLLSFCTSFSYFIHSQVSKFQLSEMDTFQSATQAGILGNILD